MANPNEDNRKFLTLTLVLPVLLFSISFLLTYSCEHANPRTKLTETEDSQTEMVVTTPNLPPLATSTSEVIFGGVKIEKKPSESKLTQLGVSSWPTWEGSPSKIPWTFTGKETMYLLKGKVKVCIEGLDGFFEIGGGDLVEFPKGMNITWEVIEAVKKHYNVEK